MRMIAIELICAGLLMALGVVKLIEIIHDALAN